LRLLLDSHALIWWADQHQRLGAGARDAIADTSNELLVSAGTIWEIAIKISLGKLTLSMPFRAWMLRAMRDNGMATLPIAVEHAAL
jgi:PIN domain nuclease of toxin-antitoxin system